MDHNERSKIVRSREPYDDWDKYCKMEQLIECRCCNDLFMPIDEVDEKEKICSKCSQYYQY